MSDRIPTSTDIEQRLPKRSQKQLIERLGVVAVEAIIIRFGWIFREQTVEDFGIDAHTEVVTVTCSPQAR